MKINLYCTTNKKAVIEILKSRNISIVSNSNITLIEKNIDAKKSGIIIQFDPENLDEFIEFLDQFININNINDPKHIVGKKSDSFEVIPLENIIYFIAEGNYTYFLTEDYRYEVKIKLYRIIESYSHYGFVRVNKSTIINILMIEEIVPWFGGRLLLKFKEIDDKIEVSRNYVKSFKNFIGM